MFCFRFLHIYLSPIIWTKVRGRLTRKHAVDIVCFLILDLKGFGCQAVKNRVKLLSVMKDCVFCGIVLGGIPANFVYQDDKIAVFTNIKPSAPVHLILIPKEHIENLSELEDDVFLRIKNKVVDIVGDQKLADKGYRLVTNGGSAKQIAHLHVHLLGGVTATREV